MAYTGYLVSVFMDANPYSPTYGQERTERELDTNECPVEQQPNYVQVYTYCEMAPNGAYTGQCVIVYEDVEPMSATYGQQREEVYTDGVLCPPDSADADWREIDSYCEQIAYQPSGKLGNSGFKITVYMDYGEYSPTYHQTREDRTQDLVHCTPPNTDPVWVTTRTECEQENGVNTGNLITYKVNTNEYSPDYNFGEEVPFIEQNLTQCPRSASAPRWEEVSYECEFVNGYYTGYATITYRDRNPLSDTYNQTKTEYVLDSRCPAQTPSSFPWRIINNRGASTDTITSITLHFNGNFDIQALGSLTPVGGQLNGSVIIPGDLKNTDLVCATIDLSPNTSLPTLFQFSQSPNPYRYYTSMGQDTLIITLWDGDGTGPEWTEISYSCETVDGYRTGASTIVEEDMNPDSATYGQQRTRTIENDTRCPAQTDAVWVETSWTCETVNGYNTGNRLSVQTDQNPNSSTYGSTRTRIIQDLENCPISTTPAWTEISYVCEQVDGFNTGNTIITEEDKNPGSPTYGQTRTRTVSDDARCVRNTTPTWVEESWVCETDDMLPDWQETSRTCQKDANNKNTGYVIIVETDMNPNSQTYQETRTSTVEDLTNCPLPIVADFKVKVIRSNSSEVELPCSYSPEGELTSGNISDFGTSYSIITSEIGDCVTRIGTNAFSGKSTMTSVSISDSVIYINDGAFAGCSGLTSLNIPDSVTYIGTRTFRNCSNISSITVGTGIERIWSYAFANCTSLTSFTCKATTPPTLYTNSSTSGNPTNVFDSTNANLVIYVPSASVSTYQTTKGWRDYASRIQAIPNS